MLSFMFKNLPTKPLKLIHPSLANYMTSSDFSKYDSTQLSLLNEECILVDQNDNKIGSETKKNCHLIENINKGMLHRAFSVFLFDTNKRLLLQQRSNFKITYPNHWTNTCCSHPLNIAQELVNTNNDYLGIKRAAVRRLNYELGIQEFDVDKLHFITRIHYRADNMPFDGIFGEHEIDYVLFLMGDFKLKPNLNEVKSFKYVNQNELVNLIQQDKDKKDGIELTPWFKFISQNFLFKWWDKLDDIQSIQDLSTIHRFN